jgi:hypothetical protein
MKYKDGFLHSDVVCCNKILIKSYEVMSNNSQFPCFIVHVSPYCPVRQTPSFTDKTPKA